MAKSRVKKAETKAIWTSTEIARYYNCTPRAIRIIADQRGIVGGRVANVRVWPLADVPRLAPSWRRGRPRKNQAS